MGMRLPPELEAKILAQASKVTAARTDPAAPTVTAGCPTKRPKYGNTRITVDGVTWDSKRERARWLVLWARKCAGQIADLRRQVRFDLHAQGGQKVCSYVADFVYTEGGRQVVEDVKGMKTPMYKLKRKWMAAEHGIEILET